MTRPRLRTRAAATPPDTRSSPLRLWDAAAVYAYATEASTPNRGPRLGRSSCHDVADQRSGGWGSLPGASYLRLIARSWQYACRSPRIVLISCPCPDHSSRTSASGREGEFPRRPCGTTAL
jgi:hypothetical protein